MGDELRYSLKKFTCWSGHLTQCFQDLFDFICTSLSALNSHFALFKTTRVHRRRLWSEFFFRCSRLWARSIQPKFPEISVQNSMDRFAPTGKVSKKQVHLLSWSTFPGRTGLHVG